MDYKKKKHAHNWGGEGYQLWNPFVFLKRISMTLIR